MFPVILAALGLGLPLFLAPLPDARPDVARETLPNGLEVLVEDRPGTATVAVRVYVKTGSLFEEPYLGAGISHLYEHLLAGGTTTTRGEAETAEILRSIGGTMNAATTYDTTSYFITTTGEHAGTAIELLADWMRNSTLDPREVARETEVVQRELEKDDDEPANVLWRVHMENAYQRSLIRLPVIGYKENVKRLTRDDLVRFYKERYAPENAVLVVVGDVRRGVALERARAAFGPWERRTLRAPVLIPEPPQVAMRRAEREMPVGATYVKIGWQTVDLVDPDLYALDTLAFALGQGDSAILKRWLIDEAKLCTAVSVSSWTPWYARGQLMVDLEVADPANVEPAIRAVLDGGPAWRDELGSDDGGALLRRAKKQKVAELVFGTQKNDGRAETLAQDLIGTGDPFFSERYVERIQAVESPDLKRVIARYIHDDGATVTIVRPPTVRPPESARPANLGPSTVTATARRITLESGLVVALVPMAGTKSVAIDARFAGGVRAETPATSGLMNLLARTLGRGTEGGPPLRHLAEVESLGGALAPEAAHDAIGLSATFLAGDLDRGLEIVADLLAHPSFPEAEIAREKRIALAGIAERDDDWQAEGLDLLRAALFQGHPYQMPPLGQRSTVERVDRAKLVEAWKGAVNPRNGVLAIAGDFAPDAAEAAVRRRFAGFVAKAPVALPRPLQPLPLRESREVEAPTGKGQTTIVLGYPGIALESGDRYALDCIAAITAGIGLPSGWLEAALRGGDRSLVSSVHAIPWSGVNGGVYSILTRCNPEDEARVLEGIRGVQKRIVEGEVTDADLARGQSIATTAHAVGRETSAERAREAALDELLGLGLDWGDRYDERVRAVTKADVLRVARRVFGPSILAVVRPEGAPAPSPAKKSEVR